MHLKNENMSNTKKIMSLPDRGFKFPLLAGALQDPYGFSNLQGREFPKFDDVTLSFDPPFPLKDFKPSAFLNFPTADEGYDTNSTASLSFPTTDGDDIKPGFSKPDEYDFNPSAFIMPTSSHPSIPSKPDKIIALNAPKIGPTNMSPIKQTISRKRNWGGIDNFSILAVNVAQMPMFSTAQLAKLQGLYLLHGPSIPIAALPSPTKKRKIQDGALEVAALDIAKELVSWREAFDIIDPSRVDSSKHEDAKNTQDRQEKGSPKNTQDTKAAEDIIYPVTKQKSIMYPDDYPDDIQLPTYPHLDIRSRNPCPLDEI